VKLIARLAVLLVVAGCGSSGGIRINPSPGAPPATALSVQALFESGRDQEVVDRAAPPGVRADDVWFGAQSLIRMGQPAEATEQYRRLRDTTGSEGFRRAADVAIARMDGRADAAQDARAAMAEFPADPFVQYEAGLTLVLQGDAAAGAQAFDAAINASPMFAYAYYQAGQAYSRLNRPDLTVARFETFVRLAPSAPERVQVESILRTARGAR
jgi:predicted Zn-dependent protease